MKVLRFAGAARAELNEAADFYEGRQPGLGRRWRLAVSRCLDAIEQNPRRGRAAGRGARKVRIDDFPYYIIFVERSEDIVIAAFAHFRREADYWTNRL